MEATISQIRDYVKTNNTDEIYKIVNDLMYNFDPNNESHLEIAEICLKSSSSESRELGALCLSEIGIGHAYSNPRFLSLIDICLIDYNQYVVTIGVSLLLRIDEDNFLRRSSYLWRSLSSMDNLIRSRAILVLSKLEWSLLCKFIDKLPKRSGNGKLCHEMLTSWKDGKLKDFHNKHLRVHVFYFSLLKSLVDRNT